jgi:catechol 2,3-dioxygenase-like lactoylglutathione lyase family enzyme
MIKGMHGMLYSTDAEATRVFFRDILGFPATDVGGGRLIFPMPEADLGMHPGDAPGFHVSFYTDDIEETVQNLQMRGVQFTKPVEDQGYGLVTCFEAPGGLEIELYQPHYEVDRP